MRKITNHISQIVLGTVNAYLIEDNGLTLIDTGYKNNTDKIFAAIKKSGRNPYDIKQVILTHCHPDHTGSVVEIKRRLNIPVYAHTADAQLMEQGLTGRMPFQLSPGILNRIIYSVFIKPRLGVHIETLKADETLTDNDVIPVLGGMQVIHTPGHSAGHIALLLKNEGVLIAGDICFNLTGLALHPFYEDRDLGMRSILKAAEFDFDKAVFGHGGPLKKLANKKIKNRFLQLQQRNNIKALTYK